MIHFLNEKTDLPEINMVSVREWLRRIAALHGKNTGDISYLFCDDEKILEINRQYLHHDYYTDIITFDYSTGKILAGDIFISTDTVATNALKYNVSYTGELYRVIVHGLLHLCGFGDDTPEKREKMTALENEALSLLGTSL